MLDLEPAGGCVKVAEVWNRCSLRWLLVMATVVAGAVAVPQTLRQPQQWQATATAAVPISGDARAPNVVSQLVANFEALVRGSAAMQQVSRETQVPVGQLSEGLAVGQSGDSNVVAVSFRAERPDRSVAVARAAARTGLALLADVEAVQGHNSTSAPSGLGNCLACCGIGSPGCHGWPTLSLSIKRWSLNAIS